jgi:glutathione S-transferase
MSKPILGYWDIRCFAEPIRHMLKYAGQEFVDKRYGFEKGSSKADFFGIRNQWFSEKFTHGLDFPNLPYYIDGDIKVINDN